MSEKIIFDIIIPCWNNFQVTKKCIESLNQFTEHSFRLILVNDASTDETAKYFKEIASKQPAVILTNTENLGFPKSVNRGFNIATAPFVIVLNNDIFITDKWSKVALQKFSDNPQVGLMGAAGRLILSDKLYRSAYGQNGHFNQELFAYISGSRMIMRREVLKKVGLFDEQYSPGYYEDVDFSMRTKVKGWKILKYVIPSIHNNGTTFKISNFKSIIKRCHGRNRKYFMRKFRQQLERGMT